jgi:hypothetical protein
MTAIFDPTGRSAGELRVAAEAIQREVQRIEFLDADARALAFASEMAEIDQDKRLPYLEHVKATSADKVTEWMEVGKLEHLGYGRSRRRGRTMSSWKRRSKILRTTPVAKPPSSAESAARTDAFIRRGMPPLTAYQAATRGPAGQAPQGQLTAAYGTVSS